MDTMPLYALEGLLSAGYRVTFGKEWTFNVSWCGYVRRGMTQ